MEKNVQHILFLKFPYSEAFGGGEQHTLDLAYGLRAHGFSVWCVSSGNVLVPEMQKRHIATEHRWMSKEPVTPLRCVTFFLLMPLLAVRLRRLLTRFVREHNVGTIYCLSLTEKLLLTRFAARRGVRVVWMEHLRIEHWLTKNPFLSLYQRASQYATVVAPSQSVAEDLREIGVAPQNIKVIYNGIDPSRFQIQKQAGSAEVRVGTVARLNVEKGLHDLIAACATARAAGVPLKLSIAGKGPELANLQAQAQELGVADLVSFEGFVADIPLFLSRLDIFCLTPIRRESFGIAAAEAEAAGLPVVATKLSGLAEVVKDGETGYVVPVGDVPAIASAITKLAQNAELRAQFGAAGKKRAEELFTLSRMVQAFALLFTE